MNRFGKVDRRDFTLVELLVVIAIIAILAGMLLPSLARAKDQAQTLRCLNDKKQMQIAWSLYSVDNNDRLVPYGLNIPYPPKPGLAQKSMRGFQRAPPLAWRRRKV